MKRLEKVDKETVNDIDNGNRGEALSQSILRNISKAFYINSIELVDNSPYMYDELRYSGTSLDDDVFIEKEKELSAAQSPATRKDIIFEGDASKNYYPG